MPTHVALLRAINVTGTGKLLMTDLRALCERIGFRDVRTYIQSGNVVFSSRTAAARTKADLETALAKKLGKHHTVVVRSLPELEAVERANPFPDVEPRFTLVVFLDEPPPRTSIAGVRTPGGEQLKLIGRELYVAFPNGQGKSKLKVPFLDIGTGRNLNTVRALVAMARDGS